ncbi:putative lipid II flippase FtsW [Bacillus sp. PS06]|uniref:putative lipid II flippase FtsW n=1 Tax=Bacillus sp. PS06 TaxID=2764176 RepID=UPI001785EB21|nr:putative lipid II flippase FtsW [Bacillus sp. PS06]MBD8070136.1 putative lipid II flippase FtsW [Bacillus sp. PS06]
MLIRHLKKFDYWLIVTILLLCSFGLLMVYSASYPIGMINYHDPNYFFSRQLKWFGLGLVAFVLAAFFPYHAYGKLSPLFVVISISLLVAVLIPGIGVERNNSQRWIQLGSFMFQPSEAVKLLMIIYFAYIYAKKQNYIEHFTKGVLPPLFILATVFLLILKQPDLGTATSILVTCGVILLCSGVRKIHLILLGSIAISGISYFAFTTPYRMKRLLSFRNSFDDPLGDGYQLVNSYLAIASGGPWGSGLGNSIQKLGYLPEAHTDFIMAIILEELGIVGLLFVIVSYFIIMLRGLHIARNSKDAFPKLLAVGLTFQLMIQVIFNLGAVSGLLPITGITLPFISYGGSSLIIIMISAGILVNVSASVKKKQLSAPKNIKMHS